MSIEVRRSSVWSTVTQPEIRVSGTWRDCTFVHIRQGGVWKEVWPAIPVVYNVVNVTITSSEDPNTNVNSEYLLDSDGGTRKRTETSSLTLFYTNLSPPWSSAHPNETGGSGWHCRLQYLSGTNVYDAGDSLNTWHVLSSNRRWAFEADCGEDCNTQGKFTISISDDGGSTVFDSATITINLTNNAP